MIVLPKQARADLPGNATQRLHRSDARGLNRRAVPRTNQIFGIRCPGGAVPHSDTSGRNTRETGAAHRPRWRALRMRCA